MKKQTLLTLTLGSILLLSACTAANPAAPEGAPQTQSGEMATYKRINAETAKQMMDEGGVTVVDVRTKEEYAEGHIPGAVLVPVEGIAGDAPDALPDKAATLLVYCRSGNRSKTASDKLVKLGYTSVYEFGGIRDWPYETETDAE